MQKNSITNKITPCCGLPFSVIYWWVSNLTLNSESDRQYLLTQISQSGVLSIDGWKVLINSGTLEADANLTKAEFLAWFDCGKQPNCEELKLIIEGYKISNWDYYKNSIEELNEAWLQLENKLKLKYNNVSETEAVDIIQRVDQNTGENVNYREVTSFADGSAMNDSKVDGVIYIKKSDKYYKRQYEKYVNIDWFSPAKDGVTDDAPKFQEAVNYLKSIGGGTLLIPAGNYAISHVDLIGKEYSNIHFEGERGVKFFQKITGTRVPRGNFLTFGRYNQADGMFLINANVGTTFDASQSVNNIKFTGIDFETDVETYMFDELLHQICAYGVNNLKIDECNFKGFLSDGISVTGGIGNTTTDERGAYNGDITITDCDFDGVNNDNRNAISIYYSDMFLISGCRFKNCTRTGMPGAIDVEIWVDAYRSIGGKIEKCRFDNIGGDAGVHILQSSEADPSGFNLRNFIISDCVMENVNRPLTVVGFGNHTTYKGNWKIVFRDSSVKNSNMVIRTENATGVLCDNVHWDTVNFVDNGEHQIKNTKAIMFRDCSVKNFKNPNGIVVYNSENISFVSSKFIDFEKHYLNFIVKPEGVGTIKDNEFYGQRNPSPALSMEVVTDVSRLKFSDIQNNKYYYEIDRINKIDIYRFLGDGGITDYSKIPPSRLLPRESEFTSFISVPKNNIPDTEGLVKCYRQDGNARQKFIPDANVDGYFEREGYGELWLGWRFVGGAKMGVIGARPEFLTDNNSGYTFFDLTLNKSIMWSGSNWIE